MLEMIMIHGTVEEIKAEHMEKEANKRR